MVLLGMVAYNTIHQSACQLSNLGDRVVGWFLVFVLFVCWLFVFFKKKKKVSPFPPHLLLCVALCIVAFVPATCVNLGV